MNHAEWLEARRQGVSGTDISVLLGVNPYKSVDDLIMDKLGVGKPFTGNSATRAGQRLEPFVANHWAKRNQKIIVNGSFTKSRIDERFVGTPDFLVGDGAGLEIKTGAEKTYKDGCPPIYETQCRWYMMVSERPSWSMCACIVPKDRGLIPRDDLLDQWVPRQPHRHYQFQRDHAWEERARQAALSFLERLASLRAAQPRGRDWLQAFE